VHPVLGEETLFFLLFFVSLGLDLLGSNGRVLLVNVHAKVGALAFLRVAESALRFPGIELGLSHQSALLGGPLERCKVL